MKGNEISKKEYLLAIKRLEELMMIKTKDPMRFLPHITIYTLVKLIYEEQQKKKKKMLKGFKQR